MKSTTKSLKASLGVCALVPLTAVVTLVGCHIWDRHAERKTYVTLQELAADTECYRAGKSAYPKAASIDELIEAIRPFARRALERSDGWNRPFRVTSSATTYRIASDGSDGLPEVGVWFVGQTARPGADLVITDGWFTRSPTWIANPGVGHRCGSKPWTDPIQYTEYTYRYTYAVQAREDGKQISLEQWREAVARDKSARFAGANVVEFLVDRERNEWLKVMRFENGRMMLRTNVNKKAVPEPRIVRTLGRLMFSLDALAIGEEGDLREFQGLAGRNERTPKE